MGKPGRKDRGTQSYPITDKSTFLTEKLRDEWGDRGEGKKEIQA